MDEKAKMKKSIVLGYAFLTWLGMLIIAPILLVLKYDADELIGFVVLAFPIILCVVLIPLFLLWDRARFPSFLSKIRIPCKIRILLKEYGAKYILFGLMLVLWGSLYYADEYDHKYGFHVPGETGLLIIFVGIVVVIYHLLSVLFGSKAK